MLLTQTLRRTVLSLALPMLVLACGDTATDEPANDGTTTATRFLVVGNTSQDFQTGTLGAVALGDMTPLADIGALHSDSVIRVSGGMVFGINRFGADNIQRIDPATWTTMWQYSVGEGGNPQDLVVLPDGRAYVTRYDQTALWIVDTNASSDAGFKVGEIDLTTFADSDGIPEMTATLLVNGIVYVALQRVDRDQGFAPVNDSLLIAIDTATDSVIDLSPADADSLALTLPASNPVFSVASGSVIWLACAGSFGVADGQVVRFDTQTGAFLDPIALEADLGGDLAAVAPTDPPVVLWSDSAFQTHASVWDIAGNQEQQRLAEGLAFVQDLAWDAESVYVLDRDMTAPGVRVFRRSDWGEVTTSAISTGLPPWSVEVLER